jgi:hypothetical protein
MGHTNIQTTEIYAKIVDKKKEWKSHSTLPLLATQNYPFWLKYD